MWRSITAMLNYVKIYEKIGSSYEIIEKKVESGEFGYSVDMSADGAEVVIGAPHFDDGNKGRAYLFVRNDLTHAGMEVCIYL